MRTVRLSIDERYLLDRDPPVDPEDDAEIEDDDLDDLEFGEPVGDDE